MPKNKSHGGREKALPADDNSQRAAQPETEQNASAEREPVNTQSEKPENGIRARQGFWSTLLGKAVRENAVLVRILAVCTVLGAATTLKNGLMLSAAAAAVTIPLYVIMALLFKKLSVAYYFAVAMLVAGAVFTPVYMLATRYFPEVSASCQYFLPITAVNAVLMMDIRITRGKSSMLRSFAAGLGDVAGFSVVLVVISALREMLGSGMLYGRLLPNFAQFRFNFIMLAPGAFLLVGLLLAIVQGIRLHAERHNNSGEAQ